MELGRTRHFDRTKIGHQLGRGSISVAFGLLVIFYFASGVTNRIEAFDTLIFSGDAEVSPIWSNPDARMLLLYRINRIAFRLADGINLGLDVYTVLGFLGAVFSAGSVVLLYRLLKKPFMLTETASIAGALTLAFSYGFLRYANEAEVYAGATFFTLLCLHLLFRCIDKLDKPDLDVGWPILSGMASGLAVTYYQPVALPLFFAAAVLFLSKRGFWQYLVYGSAGVVVYSLVIFGSLWAEHGRVPMLSEFAGLLTARTEEFEPPPFGIVSLLKAGIVILHDLTSITWLYGKPGVESFIAQHMPFHHYHSEKIFFAARNYALSSIAAVIFFVFWAWLAYLTAAAVRKMSRRPIDMNILFVLAWLAFVSATNLMLNPAEKEVWIGILPAIAILLAVFVYEPSASKPWRLGLLIALLLAHNIVGGIGIFRNEKGDLYAGRTSWIREHGERGDWILRTGDPREWGDGMRVLRYPIARKPNSRGDDQFFNFMYFYGDTAVVQNWGHNTNLTPAEVLQTLKASGNRVFVLQAAIDPRPLPPGRHYDDRYRKLVEFGRFLKAYATVVDDGPHGKTFEIDKSRLPTTLTRN